MPRLSRTSLDAQRLAYVPRGHAPRAEPRLRRFARAPVVVRARARRVPNAHALRQQRLQSILLFIYAHYADDLQLSDLAASANISVGECCRIFQNILHTTPYGYLTNYRIQTSVSLLHRDLPISQIAGLVGYNQVSNYIATFKRIIGCTPAQYRKQHLSKPDIPSS